MKSIFFWLGYKLQMLGLRFRLAAEARALRERRWLRVAGLWQIFRRPTEAEVVLAAQRFLDPAQRYTLVDVGANVGAWAARFLGSVPGGYVGFEPDARAFVVLTERFPTSHLYNLCVGGEPGRVRMKLAANTTYSSKFSYDDRIVSQVVEGTVEIDQVTLDASEKGRGPFILKIDVQGAEAEVLAGAPETLRQTALVILETPLFPQTSERNGLADVVGRLGAAGFQPCYFCQAGLAEGRNSIPVEHDVIFVNTAMIDPVSRIK